MKLQAILAARGFRDGLLSLNDRDLAIRLMRLQEVSVAYTDQWTAIWHMRTGEPSLSTPRSRAKIAGLRWFWRIYGNEMSDAESAAFFDRALRLFGVNALEIQDGDDAPPHVEPRGDLLVEYHEQLR